MPLRRSRILLLALVFLASAGALCLHAQTGRIRRPVPRHLPSSAQRELCDLPSAHASDKTALGDFEGASLAKNGVTTTFVRHDDKFFVRTGGPTANPASSKAGSRSAWRRSRGDSRRTPPGLRFCLGHAAKIGRRPTTCASTATSPTCTRASTTRLRATIRPGASSA